MFSLSFWFKHYIIYTATFSGQIYKLRKYVDLNCTLTIFSFHSCVLPVFYLKYTCACILFFLELLDTGPNTNSSHNDLVPVILGVAAGLVGITALFVIAGILRRRRNRPNRCIKVPYCKCLIISCY